MATELHRHQGAVDNHRTTRKKNVGKPATESERAGTKKNVVFFLNSIQLFISNGIKTKP